MQSISLEERLKEIFENITNGKIDKEVFSFTDLKTKFVNIKPRVTVKAEFTDGKTAEIDVSDYFKEVVR